MPDLEIIGVPFSNYVRSVRMLCEEKGVPYTLTSARPHAPEVIAIHPAGQIPCLRHGEVKLFESKAIATYIDRVFPGTKYLPEEPVAQAQTEQWVSYGNVKVDRWLMRECVVPSAFFDKAKGPDTTKINASVPEIAKCAKILDAAVAQTGFLVGDRLTYADMNVLPMLTTAMLYPVARTVIEEQPNLMSYITALSARPSYVNTAPPPRK
jgi:glutathione S-transferase